MKLLAWTCSALTVSCVFSSLARADIQNEISAGLSDIKDQDDQFIGVQYKRYLTAVSSDSGPYLINPYLQRVNDVSVRYFTLDDQDEYQLGGTWYLHPDWVVSGDYRYIDIDRGYIGYSNDHYQSADLNVGYFVDPNWQVGMGMVYEARSVDYSFPEYDVAGSLSNEEWSPSVFTRYTDINGEQGWDWSAEYTFSEEKTLELEGRYFFNAGLSLSGTYTYLEGYDYGAPGSRGDGNHLMEVGVDYWFNPNFNVRFGLGTDLKHGDGLSSATLMSSLRF